MTKKNIAFPFVGDSIGGSHISTIILIKELINKNVNPIVFLHEKGVLSKYLDDNNIEYEYINNKKYIVQDGFIILQFVNMIIAAFHLFKFLHRYEIDIVHTNDIRMHYTWLLASKLAKCKHLWHQRTAYDSRRNSFYSFFSDSIVTISKHCKSSLPKKMKSRCLIIYDPFVVCKDSIDREYYRNQILDDKYKSDEVYIVTFVGKYTQQKRPKVAIDIAESILSKTDKDILFCFIGDTDVERENELNEYAKKLNIHSHIKLMGVKHPIEAWIYASDVLLATAVNEGLGRCLVEAQLLGVPVLATSHGGHLEVIEDSVTGYTANDLTSFVDRLLLLINDIDKKEKIIEYAKDSANKKFSLDKHINQILHLYNKMSV